MPVSRRKALEKLSGLPNPENSAILAKGKVVLTRRVLALSSRTRISS